MDDRQREIVSHAVVGEGSARELAALREENRQLRESAQFFGALAERLNAELQRKARV